MRGVPGEQSERVRASARARALRACALAALSGGFGIGAGCQHSTIWIGRAGGDNDANTFGESAAPPVAERASVADSGAAVDPGNGLPTDRDQPDPVEPQGAAASEPDSGAAERDAGHVESGPAAPGSGGTTEPLLPTARNTCPPIATGIRQFDGVPVELWVGEPVHGSPGPLILYWHGAGSSSEEGMMLSDAFAETLTQGGVVAAFTDSTMRGRDTGGMGIWYTGDFAIADEIVACTVQAGAIDPHRIYTGGCSFGGLQAGAMVYLRSNYLAAAMLNSGGAILRDSLPDAGHIPAVIAAHGGSDGDVVIVNFAEESETFVQALAEIGGFAVICDHGGGHCGAPDALRTALWRFSQAHPFDISRSPYASGLPRDFPSSCKIVSP